MNESDDKTFEEYLGRSSEVSRRYRDLSSEAVPPQLDERVLAEARVAVAGKDAMKSRSRAMRRWSVPLALAASVTLVVAITFNADMQKRAAPSFELRRSSPTTAQEQIDSQSATPPAPAASARARAPAASPQFVPEPKREVAEVVVTGNRVSPVAENAALPVGVLDDAALQTKLRGEIVQPPPRLPARDSDARVATETDAAKAAGENERRQEVEPGVQSGSSIAQTASRPHEAEEPAAVARPAVTGSARNDAPPAAGPRDSIPTNSSQRAMTLEGKIKPAWEQDPKAWLEHIRELRKQGQVAGADREWTRFREAYPRHEVAETDEARPQRP